MDIERKFNDLGVDAITGVKLMQMLGLSSSDFMDPARFMRFKDVIDYFKAIPGSEHIVTKITTGKVVDRLDHVWGYTELARQKAAAKKEAEELGKQIRLSNIMEEGSTNDLIAKSTEIAERIENINDQMYAYEK